MSYLGSNATGLFEIGTNGLIAQTAKGVFTTRTISAGTGITITNPDGVSGAPSFALTSGIATAGTYTKLTVDTFGRVTLGAQLALADIQSAVGTQANSAVFVGPTTGGPLSPTFRVLANTDITGFGTISTQNANAVAITGGTINSTPIGGTTPSTGAFTTLNASTSFTLAGTTVSSIATANGLATLDGSGKLTNAQIPAALVGAVVYQGTWNASTNTPTLTSGTGTKGNYYKVSVTGSTALDGISQWNAGDTVIFDGTTWDKIDGIANEVISVAGRTGVITLAVADITGAAPLASPTFTGTVTIPAGASIAGYATLASPTFTGTVTIPAGASIAGYLTTATAASTYAPIASPTFTGTAAAPTAAVGDISTTIATTSFTNTLNGGYASVSVAGSANVTLTAAQYGVSAVNLTGAITANISVIVPTAAGRWTFLNNTTGAFTVTVKTSAGSGVVVTQGKSIQLFSDGTNVLTTTTDFPSIALTGVPTVTGTAPAAGTNTTQIATTAFVQQQFAATTITNTVVGFSGTVTLANLIAGGLAPIASPTFTGTPSLTTTPAVNDNTTKLASTAYVIGQSIYSPTAVFTGAGSYTASATDYVIVINKISGAATGVTLPSSPTIGRLVLVKDGKGDAGTNNITVTPATGTIDGAASIIMDQPYEAYEFIYNGTSWNIV